MAAAKLPPSYDDLVSFQRSRLSIGSVSGLRDVAMAAFCFFGLRRCAEALRLEYTDISFESCMARCFIRYQKNASEGKGSECWIPQIPSMGDLCPVKLLKSWVERWRSFWYQLEGGVVFCSTTSPVLRAVSYDGWRKSLAALFGGKAFGTHSLRQGDTHWYKRTIGLDDEIIHAQGGWSSKQIMRDIYARLTQLERQKTLCGKVLLSTSRVVPHRRLRRKT